MRGIVGLFVVLLIGGGILVYMQGKMAEEPGPRIYLAFGDPQDGEMEVKPAQNDASTIFMDDYHALVN